MSITPAPLGEHTPLHLATYYNNQSATTSANLDAGRLNIWRNSIPRIAKLVSVIDGVRLSTSAMTGKGFDNVVADGQTIDIAPRRYDWLYLIAAGERALEDELTFVHSGGFSSRGTIRISDLWHGDSRFGEEVAHRSAMTHYPNHVQQGLSITLWAQRVAISDRRPVSAVTLPFNPALHIFAATLVGREVA